METVRNNSEKVPFPVPVGDPEISNAKTGFPRQVSGPAILYAYLALG